MAKNGINLHLCGPFQQRFSLRNLNVSQPSVVDF